ncbi:exosortase-associated protein EpsI, B-type [Candidatus Symbiobacter mobilis]|uniref:Methanolan biosynthesis EpsI domain-containing protein n=1 Tax=Candidatus Symbiobacter mobilis CR TaxID=946483 RepID=U5N7G1_9BURK|nr:exosortase-associated protein EpsI, B-type [Candidatus Symbiobacter mobilis]AGX87456.1 hypothetical protein Cenrod_1369 [Candidatus Symbiobacter mobilis CR]
MLTRNLLLMAGMLLAAALGALLRPTHYLADELPAIDLERMVPKTVGLWREETNTIAQVVNPQQTEMLQKLYSQTLSRVYIDPAGYRVMLSVAYGKNQSDDLQLHKPEICYPAQGFTLLDKQPIALNMDAQQIPAIRLQTTLGRRVEPVTYWTVVGEYGITSGLEKKWVEWQYALDRRIPDGMLVRVSSVDEDTGRAFEKHREFASALRAALAWDVRQRFLGKPLQGG